MVQVQLRVPDKTVKEIDKWVKGGRFRSRSDAVKAIISFYEEREKTMKFFKMLMKRSSEAKRNPKMLIRLEELE